MSGLLKDYQIQAADIGVQTQNLSVANETPTRLWCPSKEKEKQHVVQEEPEGGCENERDVPGKGLRFAGYPAQSACPSSAAAWAARRSCPAAARPEVTAEVADADAG